MIQLFFPGRAIYDQGKIGNVRLAFMLHCHHLYAVLTRQINDKRLQERVKMIVAMDTCQRPLLSPIADVSTLGYSEIACFLEYI
jgi:hypothetical protein